MTGRLMSRFNKKKKTETHQKKEKGKKMKNPKQNIEKQNICKHL